MVGLSNADAEAARQILNDIDNHQFKHALTKVDRKLKKTDSDYFKVRNSAFTRVSQFALWLGQVAQLDEG